MTLIEKIIGGAPKVTCGECTYPFVPILRDVPSKDGGAVRRFECPHCGHVIDVAVFTRRGVELMNQVQEAAELQDLVLLGKLQKKLQKEVRRPTS